MTCRGFAEAQLRMLRRHAAECPPRRRLVYATCSSEPEENEAVVERFSASDARFQR